MILSYFLRMLLMVGGWLWESFVRISTWLAVMPPYLMPHADDLRHAVAGLYRPEQGDS